MILRPNPRSPNINKITRAITQTLEEDPELLQYKTKGILAAGKFVSKKNESEFDIDFSTPSYGGILDGGHNFFAIIRVMLIESVKHKYSSRSREDKRIRKDIEKIRSLHDLIGKWRTYGDLVETLLDDLDKLPESAKKQDGLARKFSFLEPIEIITPRPGTTENEVKDIIHRISVARNNNVQLSEVAIAQHKGSYEYLKQILPEDINALVQWKAGENQCPIAPSKIVPLALLPLKVLENANVLRRLAAALHTADDDDDSTEEAVFPEVKLMSMYTSTAGCISIYSQVIDAVDNLKTCGDDAADEIADSVLESLRVIQDLPRIWDVIEYKFEEYFSLAIQGNEKKYADIPCNSRGPAKKETPTRFYTRQIPRGRYACRGGFATPLFMSICLEFLAYDEDSQKVEWVVSPDKLVDELSVPDNSFILMMRDYIGVMKDTAYDPSKFGKSSMIYSLLKISKNFQVWVQYVKHS